MKKLILVLMLGLLLIGVNAYAQGDLIVNGKTGAGTAFPLCEFNVRGGSDDDLPSITPADENDVFVSDFVAPDYDNFMRAGLLIAERIGTGGVVLDRGTMGFNAFVYLSGNEINTNANQVAGRYAVRGGQTGTGSTTWARGVASSGFYGLTNNATVVGSAIDFYGEGALVMNANMTNAYNFYGEAHKESGTGGITNAYGMLLEKQTAGTNNVGIWLKGDDAGADIAFGLNHETRIYSSGGRLYAQDSANNKTIFSPHDPVTGEWIFYSQNVKTGKTVRVNMEKLVKAVEKLTGEKFMIETIEEMK